AERNEAAARQERDAANAAREEADKQRQVAEKQRDEALRAQSRYYTGLASTQLEAGNEGDALAIALAGLPPFDDLMSRPIIPEALSLLRNIHLRFRPLVSMPYDDGQDVGLSKSDGRYVIATDGAALLFEPEGDTEVHAFPGYEDGANATAFSPDGAFIAIAHSNGLLNVYDAQTFEVVGVQESSDPVTALEFAPNSTWLAIAREGSDANYVDIVDVVETRFVHQVSGYNGSIVGFAFSPDSQSLLTADTSGEVYELKPADGLVTGPLVKDTLPMFAIAMAPDGERFALASVVAVEVYDLDGDLEFLRDGGQTPTALEFGADGDLFIGYTQGKVERWVPGDDDALALFKGHDDAIRDIEISSDAKRLYTVSEDLALQIWRLDQKGTGVIDPLPVPDPGQDEDFHVSDKGVLTMITRSETGFDIIRGSTRLTSLTMQAPGVDASVNVPLERAITLDVDGTVTLWSFDGEELSRFSTGSNAFQYVAVNADGKIALTWSDEENAASLWNVETGARFNLGDELWSTVVALNASGMVAAIVGDSLALVLPDGSVERVELPVSPWRMAISDDGKRAFVADFENTLVGISLADGQEFVRIAIPATDASRIMTDASGRFVAVWGTRWAGVWRAEDGELVRFSRPARSVLSAALSPDGTLFAFVDVRGKTTVISTETGQEHMTLPSASDPRSSPVFSRESAYLLIRGKDEVRIHRTYNIPDRLILYSERVSEGFSRISDLDRCRYNLPDRGTCATEPDKPDYLID
ncbi:WD40 repeat domain-containing protein, partial [Aestuariivita boseongensis]|uniref:WD40 repeat domain-containing protein n=1 Tax=Aestuariivita boseongensis TaxID=1470562 RepID=UPI00155DA38A